MFRIELREGQIVRWHIDRIRARTSDQENTLEETRDDDLLPLPTTSAPQPQLRRSSRDWRPPNRLMCVHTKKEGVW